MRSPALMVLVLLFGLASAGASAAIAKTVPLRDLIPVPLTRQATDYTCGAAALQSVLGYHGEDINEGDLAKALQTDPQNGTRYSKIAEYAGQKGYAVQTFHEMSLQQLKALLDKKTPVICLIQAWSDPPVKSYAQDWDDGHYVVAVGYDSTRLYFMDPSTLGHYTYIPVDEFLQRWHDKEETTKLVHFGMTVSKPATKFDTDEIKHMD